METRDGDAKIGFDGQGSLEELIMGRPIRRHKVFSDGSNGLADVCLVFKTDGAMIEFTESAEGQDEIHAADMTGIMNRCTLVIEAGDDGIKFFAGVDRPVDV